VRLTQHTQTCLKSDMYPAWFVLFISYFCSFIEHYKNGKVKGNPLIFSYWCWNAVSSVGTAWNYIDPSSNLVLYLRRDFGKSNNLNTFQFRLTCLLFNLFTVKITKRKQNDVTLLNKFLFLLMVIFLKFA